MLLGDLPITGEMLSAVEGGEIRVEGGSKEDARKFFSYFDRPVDVGSINLIVR